MKLVKEQPAKITYFLGPGYSDLGDILEKTFSDCNAFSKTISGRGSTATISSFNPKNVDDYWDLMRLIFIAGAVCGFWILSGLFIFTLAISQGIALFIGSAIVIFCVCILRGFDWVWRKAWRLGKPCPKCFDRGSEPYFLCPGCGAKHTQLIPGAFGAVRRFCECGVNLPVVHALGRSSLECFCGICDEPILNVESADCHLAFVGGAYSGKTNLFFMSLLEMTQTFREVGYESMAYADPQTSSFVEGQLKQLASGKPVAKTTDIAPRAIQFLLQRVNVPVGSSVYFYDVAGEAFVSDQSVAQHAFYDHIDGVFFVIDPLSLEQIVATKQEEIDKLGLIACQTPPEEAYARMLYALHSYCANGESGVKKARVSVVIAKGDIFNIQESIAADVESAVNASADKVPNRQRLESDSCRKWLSDHGEGNLVRLIEGDFKHVQYFVVSALGRIPASNDPRAFQSSGIRAPITWCVRNRLRWR